MQDSVFRISSDVTRWSQPGARPVKQDSHHDVDADRCPIASGKDGFAQDPGERFGLVLTNPSSGKKFTIAIVNE